MSVSSARVSVTVDRVHQRWILSVALGAALTSWAAAAFYEESRWQTFVKANNCKALGRDPNAFEPASGAPNLFDCSGVIHKRW